MLSIVALLSAPAAAAPSSATIDLTVPSGNAVVADITILTEGSLEFGFDYGHGAQTDLPYLPVLFAILAPGGQETFGATIFAYHPGGVGASARVEPLSVGGALHAEEPIRAESGIGYGWFPAGDFRLVVATAPAQGDVRLWFAATPGTIVHALDVRPSIFVRGYDAADVKAFAKLDPDRGLVAWRHGDARVPIAIEHGFVGFMGHGLPRADHVVTPSGETLADFDLILSAQTGTFEAAFPERTQIGPECQDLSGQFCYLMYPNALLGVDVANWGAPPPPPPR